MQVGEGRGRDRRGRETPPAAPAGPGDSNRTGGAGRLEPRATVPPTRDVPKMVRLAKLSRSCGQRRERGRGGGRGGGERRERGGGEEEKRGGGERRGVPVRREVGEAVQWDAAEGQTIL